MTGKLHPEAAELQKTLAIDEGASKLGTVDMQVGSTVYCTEVVIILKNWYIIIIEMLPLRVNLVF